MGIFRTIAGATCVAVPPRLTPFSGADAPVVQVEEGQTPATLRVPANRAVVVESDVVFSDLSVASPEIADIVSLSDRSIYVFGRTPGRTTLTLFGADGTLLANVDVQVVPDVAELRERLREGLPGEPGEMHTASDGVVLTGTVSSRQVVDRAMALADLYAAGRVSYLVSLGGERSRLDALVSLSETQPIAPTEGQERQKRCTVTEVGGFLQSHPPVLNGEDARMVQRAYVGSS